MASRVCVAVRVKAAPERASAAFVDEFGAWRRSSALFETTPRPGRLSFEPGAGGRLVAASTACRRVRRVMAFPIRSC